MTVAVIVFVPAMVALSDPLATPAAVVTAAGWTSESPLPLAVSTTLAPEIGFPPASRAVTVMVETLEPELADIVSGETPTDVCDADTGPADTVNGPEVVPGMLVVLALRV